MKARRNPLSKLIKIVGNKNNQHHSNAFDDNESVGSSNISVNNFNKLSRVSSMESKQQEPRNVSFDLAQNEYYEDNEALLSDVPDFSDLWYNDEDCKAMKQQEKRLIKSIHNAQQQQQQQPSFRNRRMEQANDNDAAYISALSQVYQACRQGHTSTQEQEDNLRAQMATQGPRHHGLEFKIISSADTKDRRNAMVELMYHSVHATGSVIAQRNPEASAQHLRKACAHISRPARIFAVQVARAQCYGDDEPQQQA